MKKNLLLITTAVLFLLLSNKIKAVNKNIIINEIAWMGTSNSANDEWIELKNLSNQDIDLSGWSIKSSDGKIKISLEGNITANGFYLLERTDDTSLPEIKANLIYKGSLNNSGMNLGLYDNLGLIVDNLNYSSGWPAGDNTTKQTAERNISNLWHTSKDFGGTPSVENSTGYIKPIIKKDSLSKKSLTVVEKTDNKNSVAFAAITDSGNKNDSFIILLISSLLILISGGLILFLKLRKKI